LEDLYAHRKKIEEEEWARKRQAWYTWLCSTNRPIFGQERFEFHPFGELFPVPKEPESPSDPAELKKQFDAHNIHLVDACAKIGIRPPTK